MEKVIIVHLRRPRSKASKPEEMRSDPFWEFGSFGITTCHDKNLMHPKNAESLSGVRFAFAQGGTEGTRLVHLTPPVRIVKHHDRIEASWAPAQMPFRYQHAPILVSNNMRSHFPRFAKSMGLKGRATPEGQFSSDFRSRTSCIADEFARELVAVYSKKRKGARGAEIAQFYDEALPWTPPSPDRNRERTYAQFLSDARGRGSRDGNYERTSQRQCAPKRRRSNPSSC